MSTRWIGWSIDYGSAAAWRGVDLYAGNLFGEHISAEGCRSPTTPFAALVLWPTNLGNQAGRFVGLGGSQVPCWRCWRYWTMVNGPLDVKHRALAVFGWRRRRQPPRSWPSRISNSAR